jgi:release factor glutamine methyltransferase
MTLDSLVNKCVSDLQKSGIENSLREVRLMLASILNKTHEEILFDPPRTLKQEQQNILSVWVERRCQHEPLAKIIGKKEFWGRNFKVTKDTLDPRPDSETLIDVCLEIIPIGTSKQILDLGTGSGCLILTLLAERPDCSGLAIDISQATLDVAQENAKNLNLCDKVHFRQSDWFSSIDETFDIIISNPPYISKDDVLSDETLYDPHQALFAGNDGFADYQKILRDASRFLEPHGKIVFEIGRTQAEAIIKMARSMGYTLIKLQSDLGGRDRCLVFEK